MAIKIKASNKGLLHKKLGVKQGDHIPVSELQHKLEEAKSEHNVKLEREIQFALNAHKFNHGKS